MTCGRAPRHSVVRKYRLAALVERPLEVLMKSKKEVYVYLHGNKLSMILVCDVGAARFCDSICDLS